MKFDFDEWAQLAKQDKVAFEAKRAATIKQFIDDCASNEIALRRLNGLQFKINMLRRKHKTPIGACIAISELLMDQVYQFVTLDIDVLLQHPKNMTKQNKEPCKVIPLDTLKRQHKLN